MRYINDVKTCPNCGLKLGHVFRERNNQNGYVIRYRKCGGGKGENKDGCGFIWSTIEIHSEALYRLKDVFAVDFCDVFRQFIEGGELCEWEEMEDF